MPRRPPKLFRLLRRRNEQMHNAHFYQPPCYQRGFLRTPPSVRVSARVESTIAATEVLLNSSQKGLCTQVGSFANLTRCSDTFRLSKRTTCLSKVPTLLGQPSLANSCHVFTLPCHTVLSIATRALYEALRTSFKRSPLSVKGSYSFRQ